MEVEGPIIHHAVWTWEVPLYFWFGGIATGSSFVAVACDAAGDHRSATIARRVTLAAVGPGAPLLVLDLGRPLRFLHIRIPCLELHHDVLPGWSLGGRKVWGRGRPPRKSRGPTIRETLS